MSYLNSVTIVGFVGADPEQRQARNNGSKSTVLSVATQRSWKNGEDEWVSKVEWHRVANPSSGAGGNGAASATAEAGKDENSKTPPGVAELSQLGTPDPVKCFGISGG